MSVSFYEFTISRHTPNPDLLSPEELRRCRSYLHPESMRVFATCRTLLRQVLGQWLKIHAQNVPIRIGAYGKPETEGIYFNLSHAHDKMILALSLKGPVGVDLEKIDPAVCTEEMEAFFSIREKKLLADTSMSKRLLLFFTFWVKKEAALKELGTGICMDLEELDTLDPQTHHIWTPLPVENFYIAYLATSYEVTHVRRCALEHES